MLEQRLGRRLAPDKPGLTRKGVRDRAGERAVAAKIRVNCHRNTIIKRGIYGVYHHVSQEHLKRYLCEFDFRYNYRTALGFDDPARATLAIKGIAGKRLTYRQPIGEAHA